MTTFNCGMRNVIALAVATLSNRIGEGLQVRCAGCSLHVLQFLPQLQRLLHLRDDVLGKTFSALATVPIERATTFD
jgi:hypothetical protein